MINPTAQHHMPEHLNLQQVHSDNLICHKLIGLHPIKKFPKFYQIQGLITVLKTAHLLPYVEPNESQQNPIFISLLSHILHMPHPSHPPIFDQPINTPKGNLGPWIYKYINV